MAFLKNKARAEMPDQTQFCSLIATYVKSYGDGMSDWRIFQVVSDDEKNLPTSVKIGTNGKAYLTVMGANLPVIQKVPVKWYGTWSSRVDSRTGGISATFKAVSWDVLKPQSRDAAISLMSSSMFRGIGNAAAGAMYDAFGDELWRIIAKHPQKLVEVRGITLPKAKMIHETYMENIGLSRLQSLLLPLGFKMSTVTAAHAVWHEEAAEKIKKNPYCLVNFPGVDFSAVDVLGKAQHAELDSYERIMGAVLNAVAQLTRLSGDTYAPWHAVYEHAMTALNADCIDALGNRYYPVDTKRLIAAVHQMTRTHVIAVRNFSGEECVFKAEYDRAEQNAANAVKRLLSNPIPADKAEACRAELKKFVDAQPEGRKLSQKQQAAVLRSLESRVSIITGGPGTGKTTILSAVLDCYEKVFGSQVTLMAPTGKAARRMSESTHRDATTIHSRLKLIPGPDGSVGKPESITAGLIVVDESSMIDQLLMESLMAAIGSPECHLVFVGDIDQLPSVGAGSVLNDMISSGAVPVSKLTEIFRQKGAEGASIIANAAAVNDGRSDLEEDDSFRIINVSSEDAAADQIKKLYSAEIAKWGIDQVALLTPLRASKTGVLCNSEALNPVLRDICNPAAVSKPHGKVYGREYRVGDRVMCLKNIGAEVSNGDIGAIRKIISREGSPVFTIQWEGGAVSEFTASQMSDVTWAYAMSIHKSQGSEYNCVIIPVLSYESRYAKSLLKRNLLYTGITRAKKCVILVCDNQGVDYNGNPCGKALQDCVQTCDTNTRSTLFAQRLMTQGQKSDGERRDG